MRSRDIAKETGCDVRPYFGAAECNRCLETIEVVGRLRGSNSRPEQLPPPRIRRRRTTPTQEKFSVIVFRMGLGRRGATRREMPHSDIAATGRVSECDFVRVNECACVCVWWWWVRCVPTTRRGVGPGSQDSDSHQSPKNKAFL